WMRQVFGSLTDEQQQVLSLRVVADLSLEETARVMGKRVGAVKALQRRALATVRGRLSEDGVS
ncbi:MAG TPA: sigma factor-like helix-turn-helix DNA-binding protein, partial [Acidimicrobiia bacterium]|nr:sigma factor-like helix-turn-helix DNA-binding protein [Acidimicrobiia bacterium]